MKKQKNLYEDVVVGGDTLQQKPDSEKKQSESSESQNPPQNTSRQDGHEDSDESPDKEGKGGGKDEKSQADLEQRAEKLAEDPYMTSAEMKNMDGGTKEKEQQADGDDSKKQEQEEKKQTQKEVDILVSRADKILFTAKGLFPFDFFPNTITIDANKVNVIISTFFLTETITSILLKEIMDVRVETTLFLGKLIIDYGPHPLKISTVYIPSLRKSDALKAKEIIEGILVLYRSENIDTTKLKPEETLEEVKEIGKVEEREDQK